MNILHSSDSFCEANFYVTFENVEKAYLVEILASQVVLKKFRIWNPPSPKKNFGNSPAVKLMVKL